MKRTLAAIWLALVAAAAIHLGVRMYDGMPFGTDLLALLPQEPGDAPNGAAIASISESLSRRVLILVGHRDAATARAAARRLSTQIESSALLEPAFADPGATGRLIALYFRHRQGLLSSNDRRLLLEGKGEEIADRAAAQIFSPVAAFNARSLRADPFLLLPSFLAGLPLPDLRFTMDAGMLSRRADGTSWILLPYRLKGSAYALHDQERLVRLLDSAYATEEATVPGLKMLRTGAVFFAHAGAQKSLAETTVIVIVSVLAISVMVLAVFRALGPLWQSLLTIGIGILCALSLSLAVFEELHVVALLFGSSLIGTTVDYSLHYCCETFGVEDSPAGRLRHVLPGMSLGVLTTLIGYLALLLAPFPGLRQIAVFSVIGVVAAFVTVVLWLPIFDRRRAPPHGPALVATASRAWALCQAPKYRAVRLGGLLFLAIAGFTGLMRVEAVDDIRRMQALDAALLKEQAEVQSLIGGSIPTSYFVVRGTDIETALQREEALAERLTSLQSTGAIAGYRGPAQFVPSAARQHENARLVRERLVETQLARHQARLGLTDELGERQAVDGVIRVEQLRKELPFLENLIIDAGGRGATHLVLLDHVSRPDALRAAAAGIRGVRLVEPAADFSRLLGEYRRAAVILVALSAALMVMALVWRYGLRGAVVAMVPPVAAVLLTPGLLALAGRGFTFFDAMALVLVLAIGADYALFCAEAAEARRPVTLLAISLAALSTILSFGLLAFSSVFAVQAFGVTMTCGIALAFLLSPIARGVRGRRTAEGL